MDERLGDLTVGRFLERLSASDPTPGGGSAAALAGATSAALIHMVVELSSGRPEAAEHEETLTEVGAAAAAWQSELLNLAELDAKAYAAVVAARRLPRGTDLEREARTRQLATAVREATRVPLVVARAASAVLGLAEGLAPIGSRNAISDVGVAALLAVAAVRGAAINVEINLPHLAEDDPLHREAGADIAALLISLDDRDRAVRRIVAERLR